MRFILMSVLAAAFTTGCAAPDLAERRAARRLAYDSFSPETRSLVDQGRLELGMDTNAVFIAWGEPSRVIQEDPMRPEKRWLYYGTKVVELPYWQYRYERRGWGTMDPRVEHYTRRYLQGEVNFWNGRVTSWQLYRTRKE